MRRAVAGLRQGALIERVPPAHRASCPTTGTTPGPRRSAPTPWSSSGGGRRRPGSDTTSSQAPCATRKQDIGVIVGISGRIAPPSEHADAHGRKMPPPTEHNRGSRPRSARPGARLDPDGPTRVGRTNLKRLKGPQTSQSGVAAPWLPQPRGEMVRGGGGARRRGERLGVPLPCGSGERAASESGGSVRYEAFGCLILANTRLDGVLKLDRGPHPPWYRETLPVKCRSWPRRAAPSWRPSYGDSKSLIIREPRAARSRS